jgi:ribosomal-protein-alanine N-acetyltransferase
MAARPQRAAPPLPIVTARLIVREFVVADVAALAVLAADPRLRAHAPLESRALAAARRAHRPLRGPRRSWELAVVVRRSGKLIGACDLALTGRAEADLGYMLAPRHWGHGYGTELARALVELGFADLGLWRLSAIVAIENERSRRVLENAGLQWDALLRRHVRTLGRSWDCHRYAIDRPQWLGNRALRRGGRSPIMRVEDR